MKMTRPPYFALLYDRTEITFYFDNNDRNELVNYISSLDLRPNEDYEIVIKKRKKKKTRDQNGYAWELIGQLAKKQHLTPLEVYKELIKDTHTYNIVAVRTEAVNRLIENWKHNGVVGWVAEDMGECRGIPNAHNVKLFYGTSVYSKEEMSDFIDLIVRECKAQNIPTLSTEEIARLECLTEDFIGSN